mmetsp:Transcript_118203/g.341736  ORF Transcript_118203/g.341736 Transcript_118203/m.341736 type:complete len:274 (+) Transcript_118203:706-1527(+)
MALAHPEPGASLDWTASHGVAAAASPQCVGRGPLPCHVARRGHSTGTRRKPSVARMVSESRRRRSLGHARGPCRSFWSSRRRVVTGDDRALCRRSALCIRLRRSDLEDDAAGVAPRARAGGPWPREIDACTAVVAACSGLLIDLACCRKAWPQMLGGVSGALVAPARKWRHGIRPPCATPAPASAPAAISHQARTRHVYSASSGHVTFQAGPATFTAPVISHFQFSHHSLGPEWTSFGMVQMRMHLRRDVASTVGTSARPSTQSGPCSETAVT